MLPIENSESNGENYSATERELLAVIWSLEKLRCYVEGGKITIITDHYSLLWLDNLKDPSSRLGRWAQRLQQFDCTIEHRKGKENVVPDMLSRAVDDRGKGEINLLKADDIKDIWYRGMLKEITDRPLSLLNWQVRDGKLFKAVRLDFPELRNVGERWKLAYLKRNDVRLCLSATTLQLQATLEFTKLVLELHDCTIGQPFRVTLYVT